MIQIGLQNFFLHIIQKQMEILLKKKVSLINFDSYNSGTI